MVAKPVLFMSEFSSRYAFPFITPLGRYAYVIIYSLDL